MKLRYMNPVLIRAIPPLIMNAQEPHVTTNSPITPRAFNLCQIRFVHTSANSTHRLSQSEHLNILFFYYHILNDFPALSGLQELEPHQFL